MKRLTARNKHGEAYYPECFKKCGGIGSSIRCDTCEVSHNVCEELAGYEDTRECSEKMSDLLEETREYVCDRCRYPKECETQEALENECEACGLSELMRNIEMAYTVIDRSDTSQAGRFMEKYKNIVLCEECEYMAENEYGRFCRGSFGITKLLEDGDGCSCGRKKE